MSLIGRVGELAHLSGLGACWIYNVSSSWKFSNSDLYYTIARFMQLYHGRCCIQSYRILSYRIKCNHIGFDPTDLNAILYNLILQDWMQSYRIWSSKLECKRLFHHQQKTRRRRCPRLLFTLHYNNILPYYITIQKHSPTVTESQKLTNWAHLNLLCYGGGGSKGGGKSKDNSDLGWGEWEGPKHSSLVCNAHCACSLGT